MTTLRVLAVVAATLMCAVWSGAACAAPAITAAEWAQYKEKFLDPAGRIIDNANGNISHSEGQGYGLLLSYLAENRGDFDRIWAFTRSEMLVRDDGLAAWKWDPAASPHISDTNNATDGDILIAYSLSLAGSSWRRPDLTAAAAAMARAIGSSGLERNGDMVFIKPGSVGFGAKDRGDGPIVNPSYWVFEALPAMAQLSSDAVWQRLQEDGRTLIAASIRIGKAGLPPDWVSLKSLPDTAADFPQEFGYNALRVPLYLARAGNADPALLRQLRDRIADERGNLRIVDIATGQTRQSLSDKGYRAIPALLSCILDRTPFAGDLAEFSATDYYPSTLHLLALSHARRRYPYCL